MHTLNPAAGGLPAVVEQLSHAQRECGIITEITCLGSAAHDNGGQVAPKPTAGDIFLGRGPLTRYLTNNIASFDILHLHGVWDPILLIAARVAQQLGKPYVVTPHGMLDSWSMKQKRIKKRIALTLGYRLMLNRASAIHWLNEDEKTNAEPVGLRSRSIVVPNGLPPTFFDRVATRDRFQCRLPNTVPYVLFLSRLHYKKGLDILAEAFAILVRKTPAQLVVVGPDGGAQSDFERRIKELQLESSVTVVGPVYGNDKWSALDDAACFCLPSRQEGFSMAILEALGSGLPAVVSEACHFPEVESAGAGFVVPLTPEAIAEGLRKVLTDPTPRERWGANGHRLVREKYTWDRIALRWVDIYRELGGGRI